MLTAGQNIVYAPQAIIYHPVDSARLRKNYFLRCAYSVGRQLMRSGLRAQDGVRYFGIPGYLFASLLSNSSGWASARDKKRRFQHLLHVYRDLGSIREGWLNRTLQPGIPLSQLSSGGQTTEAAAGGIRLSRPGQLEDFPAPANSDYRAPSPQLTVQ